jgi:hypothetical protein
MNRLRAFWLSPVAMVLLLFCAIVLCTVAVILSQNDASAAREEADIARTNARNAQRISRDNRAFLLALRNEIRSRRSQTCIIFERQANTAARSLRNTYEFLDALPPEEARTPLVQAIVRQLPQTERNARVDAIAPDYCQESGVGLNEPPAPLPERRDYSYLLER